ncbi:MAG: hypothetical protein DI587_17195 [Variovorax paradoxus]|nr:MAG: hypothetical protein DI583_17195 [Variovorax paradoxus]PZQ08971.1 MAG: hypothetical protein DI587_17195 [Variovorax paradoxus]
MTNQTEQGAAESLAYIGSMSDDELDQWMAEAHADTIKAGTEERDSEWHQACFCALVVLCQEKSRRAALRMH